LQTTFDVDTPSEQVRLVVARTEVCTTSAIVSHTAREYCLYSACRGRRNTACGQRRNASAELIAEWTPNTRAA
jgi:hypothetical protein